MLFRVLWAWFLCFLMLPLQAQTVLVPAGSTWKYADTGGSPGTTWMAAAFNDTAWKTGPAKLGFGNGGEATLVSYGPNASNKYTTTYFRRSFSVTNASAFTSLALRVKRDDGVVLYLNGIEVWRSNMPAGTPTYNTFASSASDHGLEWQTVTLPMTGLITGTNVLAAEVHQTSLTSSDLAFDLELQGVSGTGGGGGSGGTSPVAVTRGPYLQLGTATGIQVRWRTATATDSVVRFGTALGALTGSASVSTSTTEHIVNLSGLAPNTQYYYSVGSSSGVQSDASTAQYFITAPTPGTGRATRVWVIGDAGTGDGVQAAVRNAYEAYTGTRHTDLWLQLGDNAYDNGTDAEYQSNLFDVYKALMRKSVTWPTVGNHDTADVASAPSTLPYLNNFSFPTAGQAGGVASGSKLYYSFDFGDIHFICLDSMVSSRAAGGAMLNWLRADLAANTRAWTIAYWHHPPYSKGTHDSDYVTNLAEMRTNVVPILESYGVDLVLAGHNHIYERSYLIDSHYGVASTFTSAMKKDGGTGRIAETGAYRKPLGSVPHQGAVYSTVGSSGSVLPTSQTHPAMLVTLNVAGSMVLDINGNRLDASFLSDTGAVRDSFTVIKGSSVNLPPTVSMTSPSAGATFTAPATISLGVNAADADGKVARVDYYNGATLIGSSTTAPFTVSWSAVPVGSYTLMARATDSSGATTSSSTVGITVNTSGGTATSTTLLGKGGTWKYHTSAAGLAAGWAAPAYSDTAWAAGKALLGYGPQGDVSTVLSYGSNSANKYVTAYFRQTFQVADRTRFGSLTLNMLRDDGAVVYLNGVEVARTNMPSGGIGPTTLASTAISGTDETTYYTFTVPTSALLNGANVLAVEVHQGSLGSSDLRFDLELIGK